MQYSQLLKGGILASIMASAATADTAIAIVESSGYVYPLEPGPRNVFMEMVEQDVASVDACKALGAALSGQNVRSNKKIVTLACLEEGSGAVSGFVCQYGACTPN